METICPFCHQKHAISEAAVGKQVRCPGCHQTFTANPVTGLGSAVKAPPLPPTGDGPTTGGDPLDFLNAAPSPSSPPAMPPLSEGDRASSTDETEIMLARYRTQVKPRGEEFRKRIAHGADALKKKARALKLKHDVSSLWTAVNSQLETLGTLAITHRPPTVDISGEVAELSQIQRELSEHQVTIDSLRQGAGGRSVVKQIEGEVARLRDRQREAMIAIGRKVAAARPDMPGTAGSYNALDRVQSSLKAAEAELAEIEKDIGPTGSIGGLSFGQAGTGKDFFGAKKGSVLAGAGGITVSVVGFLWAQSHAPGNFSTLLTGGWVLKEGPYYGIMGLVCLLGVYGIVNLVRAIISQQKG